MVSWISLPPFLDLASLRLGLEPFGLGPSWLLLLLYLIPLVTITIITLLDSPSAAYHATLIASLAVMFISLLLWTRFDRSHTWQFVMHIGWIPFANVNFHVGLDSISLVFILLTTFLIPTCIVISRNAIKNHVKEYMICFLLLELLLILCFSVLDLFLFYVAFEGILLPMFILIGVWGSRSRKIGAAYQFFIYTLIGSLLFLLAICSIYFSTGTTDIQVLSTTAPSFPSSFQTWLWLAFFASFAVKIPMVPFHTWLPEAHVEAPTAGSVLLAGVLLKLGGYGFLRFSIPMFPEATIYFTPLVQAASIIAVIYISLTTLRQVDLKKIIAYSSVAHMAFVTLGLFSLNSCAIEGSIVLMISHGIVSSALFMCVGVLYDRHHTRIIRYYAGLIQVMPLLMTLFFIFTLGNLAFPTTGGFIGEFLILLGLFQVNQFITALAATGMVLGAAYSIWLWNRIACGNLKVHYLDSFADLNWRECTMFIPLVFVTFLIGIYPEILLDTLHVSCTGICSWYLDLPI